MSDHRFVLFSILAMASAGCTASTESDGAGGADGTAAPSEEATDLRTRVLNGCRASTAKDLRHRANVTISFPAPGTLSYRPACVKISPGTRVTFEGSFASHPLQAGVVHPSTGTFTVRVGGPIHETKTGSSATFRFPEIGRFGYFCERHFASGMKGAIFVD